MQVRSSLPLLEDQDYRIRELGHAASTGLMTCGWTCTAFSISLFVIGTFISYVNCFEGLTVVSAVFGTPVILGGAVIAAGQYGERRFRYSLRESDYESDYRSICLKVMSIASFLFFAAATCLTWLTLPNSMDEKGAFAVPMFLVITCVMASVLYSGSFLYRKGQMKEYEDFFDKTV